MGVESVEGRLLMKNRQLAVRAAVALSLAFPWVWLVGPSTSMAQVSLAQIVRVCDRGSAACNMLVGRVLTIGQAQAGTLNIPRGCGVISREGPLALKSFGGSITAASGGSPIAVTAHPRNDEVKAGDRIEINADNQQCCLNAAGDGLANCSNQAGGKVVKMAIGPKR
jgi:hypothetical protein